MRDPTGGKLLGERGRPGGPVLGLFAGVVLVVLVAAVLVAVPTALGRFVPEWAVLPATVVAVAVLAGAGTYGYVGLRGRLTN